ncbi:MAG: hypothetical protein JO328_10025 [Hyphomicrobiales bacterium]|nr:hypothetical protein [Hyphomicrobiales bacterium]MBV8823503.1 hypothetical protein [Hyphomicrobiales bacterium]
MRSAQVATPVQRAHLLRVARTWFEIADQTDASASAGESNEPMDVAVARHRPM